MPEKRNKKGQFLPGIAPNPGGRPKIPQEVKEILKAAAPDAAKKLCELTKSKNEKIALQASSILLDRVYGKPENSSKVELSGVAAPKIIFTWKTEEKI